MVRLSFGAVVFCTVALAGFAIGQASPPAVPGRGGIVGAVRDSGGAAIAGAQVSVSGIIGRGITAADGSFRLVGVTAGERVVVARRIGFRPDSQRVTVVRNANVEVVVTLEAAPQHIATVIVDAARPVVHPRLRDFHARRERGFGHFFTAADIERRNPGRVTDLLRTVPGIRIARSGGQSAVTFRATGCAPFIWIDGTPASAGYLDPDQLPPSTLAGIEVYQGPATVPAELITARGRAACGVIALWSRTPPPPRRRSAPPAPATADAPRTFTADEVDVPVSADTAHPLVPVYPDSLLGAGVTGRVLAEFVVDTLGLAEMNTFRVVLSTHPRFTAAVREAVENAQFIPALRAGGRVRQHVQVPFSFSVPRRE